MKITYEPKQNEVLFNIVPIGVKYTCELCGKGEMKIDPSQLLLTSNPPLIPHTCTECKGIMHLPKQYPYIEWCPQEEIINEKNN